MGELLTNLALQLFFTVGLVIVFGLAVWLLNKAFYQLAGRRGRSVCIATGLIGTPIHELGHAFFCIVFGHKIVEISLFQPNSDDGVLGYVRHSYNRKNVYHQVGNFFIGIGPIVFGSGVLLLLMHLLVPSLLSSLTTVVNSVSLFEQGLSIESLGVIFSMLWEVGVVFFSFASNLMWWLFFVPACSIALHMSLSAADVKGSAFGLVILVLIFAIVDVVLLLVAKNVLYTLTDWCIYLGAFLLNFLAISILFSLVLVLLSGIFRLIFRR